MRRSFPGRTGCLIASPKVATYDLQPEMSAYRGDCDKCVERIECQRDMVGHTGAYDVIILNFANCDMVGHTGVFDHRRLPKAPVETVDSAWAGWWAPTSEEDGRHRPHHRRPRQLVCDAINVAMRELFLQIVYGRSQTAFSEGGLPIGTSLEDLGKGLRSQTGTIFSTGAKGVRYLELAEGYITKVALDEDNEDHRL